MSKNKQNILSFFILVIIMTVFITPFLVWAQTTVNNPPAGTTVNNPPPSSNTIVIVNPFKGNDIKTFIETIIKEILLPIGAVVAVLMIMWAGFLYVTAGGDPGRIKKAHDALLWAVIGAAILLGAWVISEAIQGTINALKR